MKQQMANMSKRLCPAVAQKVTLVRPVFNNYYTEYSATLNYVYFSRKIAKLRG